MSRFILLLIISTCFLLLTGVLTGDNKTTPLTAEEHLLEGDAYHTFGLYENATREYRLALKMNASNPDAWNNLGLSLTSLGRYEEAREALENATKLNPVDAESWYNLGYTLGMQKKPDLEVAAYEKALSIRPNMTVAWRNIGVVRFEQANYTGAAQVLEKATNYDPSSAAGWYYLGIVYEKIGNMTGAITVFKKAYALDPNQTVVKERIESIEKNMSGNLLAGGKDSQGISTGKSPLPAGLTLIALSIVFLRRIGK